MAEFRTGKQPTTFEECSQPEGQHCQINKGARRLGSFRARVVPYLVCNLAHSVYLGSLFMDQFVKSGFRSEQKVFRYNP